MTKYIVKVKIEGDIVPVYSQTPSEVAIWILEDKPFISIAKQSPYYAVKSDEHINGQEAKYIVFADKEGA